MWGLLGMGVCARAAAANEPIAWVDQIQGEVYVLAPGTTQWIRIIERSGLGDGWSLRTGENSRARLDLGNNTILPIDRLTRIQIRTKGPNILTRLFRGAIRLFHRGLPGQYEIEGPTVAAVIYGTEFAFQVADDDTSTLTLYDGRVEMTGGLTLTNGDVVITRPGESPRKTASVTITSLEAVQWCLYYAAVLDLDDLPSEFLSWEPLRESFACYRLGNLVSALEKYPANRKPATPAEQVYYAALLLSVGNVDGARAELKSVNQGLEGRLARALGQLVAVVQLQQPPLNIDISATNRLATEWLALSYVQQARGDLEQARQSARHSIERSPRFGFGWARLAELEFSCGNHGAAKSALSQAFELAPNNAQALALKGFVLAAQFRVHAARDAFEQAIKLDGALGNAWLGRGLCRIHGGDIAGGRQDLLVAAAIEPQRSLLRSYLGKAFAEEKNISKARHELALAQAIDPLDPTSWFYLALLEQNQNRINDAIAALEKSKTLNTNRFLYRSRLLLDQDQAVRSANLAALYQDAGMDDVALREANRAVNSDYANASAHAFLANSYDALRDPQLINLRYETPWFNELLLANLLAPPGVGVMPQNISQQEYSRLFERDRIGLISSTEYSSRGDWLQSASQFGQFGRLSYTLEADYRSENGDRPNQDREYTALQAQIKLQISPQDSLLLLANTLDYEAGDLRQYYDPHQASPHTRMTETQEPNLFLGYHRQWSPGSHTLLLIGRLDDSLELRDPTSQALLLRHRTSQDYPHIVGPFGLTYERQLEAFTAELQQLWQIGGHTIIAGARYQTGNPEISSQFLPPEHVWFDPTPLHQTVDSRLERLSGYLYYYWRIWEPFQIQAGLTYDHLEYPENIEWPPYAHDQEQVSRLSPKAGFDWQLATNTHLHGAWTRSLGGAYYDTSVRLEPTQIGGFNQAYRSLIPESAPDAAGGLIPGARFETFGLGLDHRFPSRTYVGINGTYLREQAERQLGIFEFTFPNPAWPSQTQQKLDYREQSLALTLNQLVGRDWSFQAQYRASLADLKIHYPAISEAGQALTGVALDTEGDGLLHELRLSALFNHPSGFFWQFSAHWHAQSNGGDYGDLAGDNFWQLDTFAGYRFRQRRATIQIGILNLADQNYRLNPVNYYLELPRDRTFVAQLRLAL